MELKKYIENKIHMLRNQFKVVLSDYQIEKLQMCNSEIAVDQVAKTILKEKLEVD